MIHAECMKTEASAALFDPALELGLIQYLFPGLMESEQRLLLKLRAATQLLTRGVNADFERMDDDTRNDHERFIQEREIKWVGLQNNGASNDYFSKRI